MHPTRMTKWLFAVAVSFILASCADPAPGSDPTADPVTPSPIPQPEGQVDLPPIDWAHPFGSGPAFSSLSDAQPFLAFEPRMPKFGAPTLIQIVNPDSLENKADQTVALVYDLPVEGAVLVEESLSTDMTLEVLRQMVAARSEVSANPPGQPFVHAFQIVPVREVDGMLVQAKGIGRIVWIEDGIVFDIFGESASVADVLLLAETL